MNNATNLGLKFNLPLRQFDPGLGFSLLLNNRALDDTLKDVLSLASLALEMVDPIPSKPMILYLLLDAVLGCQSVQAMIGEHCKERTQCHSNSIAFYFPLIRCLHCEGNARVDAGQKLKQKIYMLLLVEEQRLGGWWL